MIIVEPQPFAAAVSSNFSFSCSSFVDDKGTLADGAFTARFKGPSQQTGCPINP